MSKQSIFTALALWAAAQAAQADSNPWLPEPGAINGSVSYVYQTTDRFFMGNKLVKLPADLSQHTVNFYGEYGLSDSLALDASLGYSSTEFIGTPADGPAPFGANLDGLTDTNIGARWRVLDELIDAPLTVTLRAGGIIRGDYQVGALNAIGDGASGGEFSALIGRFFENGISLSSQIGYRTLEGQVPDNFFASLKANYSINAKTSIGVNYQVQESLSGIDIGAPGFTFARFPGVKEDYQILGGNLSYQLTPTTSVTVVYAGVVDGRNTSYHDLAGINLGFGF
ncbi:MAG: hypothetical protein PHH59_16300 [Methylovulum sp.]|uniref:hypothetical protein n=1 Tax=Methylovulum sp. TaxID=1916980 RepID=UPI002616ED4E|nr:hypothetical protein [Methylovulum sp.]MDD2725565.1 hypothetical protein [Methylovulum sp.]MDD5125365.1 hypothetical protein [Methylovulum sp.]